MFIEQLSTFLRLLSELLNLICCQGNINTAAFTYYYDPAILRNNLTPLSIFRDQGLRKRDSKNNCILLCVL